VIEANAGRGLTLTGVGVGWEFEILGHVMKSLLKVKARWGGNSNQSKSQKPLSKFSKGPAADTIFGGGGRGWGQARDLRKGFPTSRQSKNT